MRPGHVRPRARRRPAPPSSRAPFYVVLILAGAVVVGLVFALPSKKGGNPDPAAPRKAPAAGVGEKAPEPRPPAEPPKPDPFPQDLAEIDGHVRKAVAADEFAGALGILKMARGKYPLREWSAAIDRRSSRLKEEFDAACRDLEAKALEARRKGAEAEVRAALARAAKWGIDEYSARIEKSLASLPVVDLPWRTLFDGSSSFFRDAKGWRVEGGALVREPESPGPVESRETFEEGEIRIRFSARPPGRVSLAVRQSLMGNSGVDLDAAALGGSEHVLVFTMIGDAVSAMLDGSPVPVAAAGRPARAGTLQLNGRGAGLAVRSVEYRPR